MGKDLELDFEKYCVIDGSPKTVLLSPRRSKVEKRKLRKKPKCENEEFLSQNKEFTEINLDRYRSASCRAVSSTRSEVNEAPRRGSVYQKSNEFGQMNKIRERETEGRKKIEFSRSNLSPIPFEIVDSLCSSDEDSDSLGSISSKLFDMLTDKVNKENFSVKSRDSQPSSITLQKSLSARMALPHSPTKSETNPSASTTPKTRFSPFRKMFDPFTKSKSQRSPVGSAIDEPNEATITSRNLTSRKSLLNDFSNTECDSCSSIVSYSSSSPAHLHGVLKMRNKNGVSSFEFAVKNPNDVLVAKTWKLGNDSNWVYTFHTAQIRRKSNASGRGLKDQNFKDLTMIGQMQVSCYLCTETINSGAFDSSMLTEFILYDLLRPRKSVSQVPEGQNSENSETCESNEIIDQAKVKVPNFLNSKPWADADLHPDLETAAIVIQFPSEKRESLKLRNDESLIRFKLEKNENGSDWSTPEKVNVVIPSGNHSLPSGESRGPSPLLDRWRLGGGCDCGGWDMGCPLIVFGNHDIRKDEACKQVVELFLKGTKENTPALTMKLTEEGKYAVDFHAQLSSLQAFSICVAILHSTEASIAVDRDRDRQMLQCDSLRVFIEDEVKHLIDSMAEEEEEEQDRKPSKNLDEIAPSFVVNPPFSPISRA